MSVVSTASVSEVEDDVNSVDTSLILSAYESKAKEYEAKIISLQKELKAKTEECNSLKLANSRLELDIVETKMQNSQNQSETAETQTMKKHSEEVLTKAKSIIFEKTKQLKNQELQIEALNAQVSSLKDVVSITKNLLEIRNLEVKHLQDQVQCMCDKMSTEKERQEMVHAKLDKMISLNGELKREYETQLCLFNSLKERYHERELARGLVRELRENGESTEAPSESGDI